MIWYCSVIFQIRMICLPIVVYSDLQGIDRHRIVQRFTFAGAVFDGDIKSDSSYARRRNSKLIITAIERNGVRACGIIQFDGSCALGH